MNLKLKKMKMKLKGFRKGIVMGIRVYFPRRMCYFYDYGEEKLFPVFSCHSHRV